MPHGAPQSGAIRQAGKMGDWQILLPVKMQMPTAAGDDDADHLHGTRCLGYDERLHKDTECGL